MTGRLAIVVYAQHLSGVGHYVRGFEIAKALARAHDVWFIEGGRPVPRSVAPGLRAISLPSIERGASGDLVASGDFAADLETILRERRERLSAVMREIRADVLLVEHYPFSKWELEDEILEAIRAAHAANPAVRVLCSLRDVCRKTRHEDDSPEVHREKVLGVLGEHFDGLFIHCDPRFTRLEEHLPWAGEIGVPIQYTGFVAEEPPEELRDRAGLEEASRRSFAVLSAGGGAGAVPMVRAVVQAWSRLAGASAELDGCLLHVFTGLYWSERELTEVLQSAEGFPVRVRPFSADFLAWMRSSELSISRAGYNTCAGILRCGARALLIPDERMSDQRFRAERLAAVGLAEVMTSGPPDPDALGAAIQRAIARPRPVHQYSLDGAENTRRLTEELAR